MSDSPSTTDRLDDAFPDLSPNPLMHPDEVRIVGIDTLALRLRKDRLMPLYPEERLHIGPLIPPC